MNQTKTYSLWLCALLSLNQACGEDSVERDPDAARDAGGTDDGGHDVPPECDEPLRLPFSSRFIEGAPSAEDFTFDHQGYLLALESGHTLLRMARGKRPELLFPNVVVRGRGMRVLESGELLIADQDRSLLVAIDTEGGTRRVTTDIANPNGVALGPDGQAFVSDFGITGEVFRVDPSTGKTTKLASPGKGSNGLAFSPDYRTLYIGDHDLGVIHKLALSDDGSATQPELYAEGMVRPDGLASDACGILYAASWDGKLYAIGADGKVQVAAEFEGPVSAVSFGSGAQGFDRRKLYVSAISTGGLYELDADRPAPKPP
jgi:sugar lactone lactonase YvrE